MLLAVACTRGEQLAQLSRPGPQWETLLRPCAPPSGACGLSTCRQSVFLSEGATLPSPRPSRAADDKELTFTNVPFEEHKLKRGGAAGAGGSQTKWYS